MFEYTSYAKIKIQYGDIYGNRYYQKFNLEGNEDKIWFNARVSKGVRYSYG